MISPLSNLIVSSDTVIILSSVPRGKRPDDQIAPTAERLKSGQTVRKAARLFKSGGGALQGRIKAAAAKVYAARANSAMIFAQGAGRRPSADRNTSPARSGICTSWCTFL